METTLAKFSGQQKIKDQRKENLRKVQRIVGILRGIEKKKMMVGRRRRWAKEKKKERRRRRRRPEMALFNLYERG